MLIYIFCGTNPGWQANGVRPKNMMEIGPPMRAVFNDLSRWHKVGPHPQHEHITLYTQRLYAKRFGRSLQVVLLLDTRTNKYVLLASTDLTQSATEIAYYYHLRFQIEILFRDAKQFTGLTQCQARSADKLDYHRSGDPV